MIGGVPKIIPNSYVISSKDTASDRAGQHHPLRPTGYKLLGTRYGNKMSELLGFPVKDAPAEPAAPATPAAKP